MKKYPSQERLKELFDYDPEGFLVWKYRPNASARWNTRYSGSRAGSINVKFDLQVSCNISINKKTYTCQSLIYIYHFGSIPDGKKIEKIDKAAFYKIENLNLINKNESANGKSRKNKTKGCTNKYIGVTLKKNGIGYISGSAKWGFSVFQKAEDAAINYDNLVEADSGFRPNQTIKANVTPTDRQLGNQMARARLAKKIGKFTGVNEDKRQKNNRFYVRLAGVNIGRFQTETEAARAYNIAAYEHYGEHAVLNDIPDPLGKGDAF